MLTKTANAYNPKTGEFITEVPVVICPVKGDVFYNAYTTATTVPVVIENQAALYLTQDGSVPQNWQNGEWYVVSDFRGRTIWKKSDATQSVVSTFGAIADEYTLLDPSEFMFPIWSEGSWVNDGVKQKEYNTILAKNQQNAIVSEYATNAAKKALGLEVEEADIVELQEYVQTLETDIKNPSSEQTYHPPIPPGVVAPDVEAISITMTRPEGWNNTLGWKMVFNISDPEYIPANIAISVYSAENCTGYLYTPGALQQDIETGKYYAVCPAGQEKGDVGYHFGLLYGSAQLACWTFVAGTAEEVKLIYGDEDEES